MRHIACVMYMGIINENIEGVSAREIKQSKSGDELPV